MWIVQTSIRLSSYTELIKIQNCLDWQAEKYHCCSQRVLYVQIVKRIRTDRIGKIKITIRILHECQVWIDKSVPRVTFWHHEARRVMPNCDPRDRFVYPYMTRMMDSFSCTP